MTNQQADKLQYLNRLKQKCKECFACELSKTRSNVVFSDGNPESAKIILVGEAPGENEDLSGVPFVGRAGKLLDEFLNKASISREGDLYIINTVKCRPPKNRVPTEVEKAACRAFLEEQINIIEPEIILLCGATAMKSFLSSKLAISKVRGDIFEVELNGKRYKVMPIFHPSYLLRNHSTGEGSPRDLMLKDLKKAKGLI